MEHQAFVDAVLGVGLVQGFGVYENGAAGLHPVGLLIETHVQNAAEHADQFDLAMPVGGHFIAGMFLFDMVKFYGKIFGSVLF